MFSGLTAIKKISEVVLIESRRNLLFGGSRLVAIEVVDELFDNKHEYKLKLRICVARWFPR